MILSFDVKTFLLLLLIFAPAEFVFAERKDQKFFRPGWLTDVLHFFVNAIFIRTGLFAVLYASVTAGEMLVPDAVRETLTKSPVWLQVIMATIIADLGFYLAHRLMHTVPFLWHFHAVHHSSENLDWLAAYRVHPVDQVLVKGTSLVPIFVLGFSDAALAITSVIYFWQSIFLHSNIKISFGPLKWLVASPEFHHWHHANQAEAIDKNFSGQTPIWDVVFRTAYMPGPLPEKYGVGDPLPHDYPKQMFYPFGKCWSMLTRRATPPQSAPPPGADPAERAR